MKSHGSKSVLHMKNYVTTFNVVITIVALVIVALVIVAVVTPPLTLLPEAGEAEGLLSTLLTAEAAITALTIAVTIFVIQGASTKQDVDDRVYREYIRQSWVRRIFMSSLFAVGVTGLTLLAETFLSTVPALPFAPGMRNLILAAAAAFFANLLSRCPPI